MTPGIIQALSALRESGCEADADRIESALAAIAEPAGSEAVAYTDPENLADGSHPNTWAMYQSGEQSRGDIALYTGPSPVSDAGDLNVGDAVEWTSMFGSVFKGHISEVTRETTYTLKLGDGCIASNVHRCAISRLTGAQADA